MQKMKYLATEEPQNQTHKKKETVGGKYESLKPVYKQVKNTYLRNV